LVVDAIVNVNEVGAEQAEAGGCGGDDDVMMIYLPVAFVVKIVSIVV
jgi:hypothetical protein